MKSIPSPKKKSRRTRSNVIPFPGQEIPPEVRSLMYTVLANSPGIHAFEMEGGYAFRDDADVLVAYLIKVAA